MTNSRLEATIECLVCHIRYASVYADEDSAKPGFWLHRLDPPGVKLPKVCPSCHEPLTRCTFDEQYGGRL